MIEAYAFLTIFAVQVVVMSVVFPAWFIRRVNQQSSSVAATRYEQLKPGFDKSAAIDRFVFRYRLASGCILLVGLVLFGWFCSYTQRPDWDDGPVEALLGAYFFLQTLPMVLVGIAQYRLKRKVLAQTAPEPRRKATLQRRGLFDFVSPFAVFLSGVCYVLFAAYVVYIAPD